MSFDFQDMVKSAPSGGLVKRLKDGERITVRFLYPTNDETGWAGVISEWDENKGHSVLRRIKDKNESGKRKYYTVVALDGEDEPRVFEMGSMLATQLSDFFTTYGSATDRRYVLSRTGSTMTNTAYNATPLDKEGPSSLEQTVRAKSENTLSATLDRLLEVSTSDNTTPDDPVPVQQELNWG